MLLPALALSLLIHASFLVMRLADRVEPRLKNDDLPLEVVLVNAHSPAAPANPQALAQANLVGGGNDEIQRATTPLPAQGASVDGELMTQLQRRIEKLEAEKKQLLTVVQTMPVESVPQARDSERQRQRTVTRGEDEHDVQAEIARLEAEIGRKLENFAKLPRRAQLTAANTREVAYAKYYDGVRRRIEEVGTRNFPRNVDGRPQYGTLVAVIQIRPDGTLADRNDGDSDEGVLIPAGRGSGNPVLDRQTIAIVRGSAPFKPFPADMRARYDILEIIATFRFTREGLETSLSRSR